MGFLRWLPKNPQQVFGGYPVPGLYDWWLAAINFPCLDDWQQSGVPQVVAIGSSTDLWQLSGSSYLDGWCLAGIKS
jgi:hypothetical protein